MSRPIIVFLKILSIILWLITIVIVAIALIAGMSGVDIPWLDPLESLVGIAITGVGGLITWWTAQRGERAVMQQTISQNSGAVAQGDKSKAVNVGSGNTGSVVVAEVVQQIVAANQPVTTTDSALDRSLMHYLEWLRERTGSIELRGVSRAGKPVALELDKVYVPLEATTAAEEDTPDRRGGALPRSEPEEITLDRILMLGRQLVITGGPGCGKTTVLRHVAWVLATSFVTEDPTFTEQRLGLAGELPLPIYIPLSAFAEHLRTLDKTRETGNRVVPSEFRLDHFIPGYLIENAATHGLPEDFFSRLLDRGDQVILLLDGLDEVPNEAERKRVREKVEQLVSGRRDKMRVVVTCRTAAYHDQTALDKRFREVRVKPLEDEHITALVTHAYEDIYRLDPARREKKTAELLNGIRRLEDDRRLRFGDDAEPLITSPLLVRMLIIVHQREGRNMPEQRAELYWKATEVMLEPDYALDEEVADRIGRLIGGRKELHRDLSQHLAFHMHSRGEQQRREIDETGLRAVLSTDARFVPFIDDYIALTRLRGTLLEELLGTYRFVHLAFQEFLAARYLAEVVRDVDAIAAFLEQGPLLDSWWREAALLVPGYLACTSESVALSLLRRLAGVDDKAAERNRSLAPTVQLAAAEIAAVAIMEWETDKVELREAVANRLVALLADETLIVANPLRGLAGVALGRLGDPRPDVGIVVRDGLRLPDIAWSEIVPAGRYTIGGDEKGYNAFERRTVTIDRPYQLARYPVTHAQFDCFIDAPDFADPRWWAGMPAEEEAYGRLYRLRELSEASFPVANHPRERISWYQAVAFTRWLSDKLGETIGLPHEYEWEVAARFPDGRFYPWGNNWDAARVNTSDGGIGRTSAVGIFPQGANPALGLYDLSGNVLEWCRNKYEEPEDDAVDAGGARRVLRGGSWIFFQDFARAVFRNYGHPNYRNFNVGCRLVRRPPSQAL